ncbi:hypothetical protein C8R45DRAFT_939546 [Mycena sanguinolenta]|nr:hypothetical protein C8R45DRAFT_939546 [Mycena sanguinolenta]
MSNPSKSHNWGGRRLGSGRKPLTTTRQTRPTRPTRTNNKQPQAKTSTNVNSNSSSARSAPPVTALPVTSATPSATAGFFAPRASQQPRIVQAQPSIVPEQSLSAPSANTGSTIAQLNCDLSTLTADGPLDPSERVFDEGLADADGEEDDSVNAEVVQNEVAEVKILSENHQWIQNTLNKIESEIGSKLKMPRCYKKGYLWVHPIDPVFALDRAAVSKFCPRELYLLPIFVWLPNFLPGHPDSFKCECGVKLNLHGYNDNPIARRVSTLAGQDYFLLTNRYLCPLRRINNTGCGKTYQGTDPWIIRQLPEFVQRAFPASLSARSGLDTNQLDIMKATFAGHFGANLFSKLHFGFRGPAQVPQFSKFDDPSGYAGYAPSTQYIKTMFTAWFSLHRNLVDRVMSSLSATVIKADHTYKCCLPGGEPIHAAMYSIVNSDEEIRAYAFTLTQSFPPLREVFERMQAELRRHGHSQTQLMYTDNPRAERKFHESVNPSLCENVQHIVLDPFRDLPPFKPSGIPVSYFNSPTAIDSACEGILENLSSLPPTETSVISLAVKCTPEALNIIQVSFSEKAYVFHVTQIKSKAHVPACLLAILTNKHIIKIGPHVRKSMQSISSAWSLSNSDLIGPSSVIDLAHIAKLKGAVSDATSSLPTLAGTVLKQSLPDFSYISAHDWSDEITENDVTKLAHEVDCISQIYHGLMKIDSVGLPLQPSQIFAGQLITLVIGKASLTEGELVAHSGRWPSPSNPSIPMKITEASTVIKLTKLLVPGYIVARHSQTLQWLMDHGEHAVVQIRTLRSRAPTPPHPSDHDPSLGVPAAMNPPQSHPSDEDTPMGGPGDPNPSTPPGASQLLSPDPPNSTDDDEEPEDMLPEQLLRHHKKTLQWKSSRATLYMGSNTECLAPIQELLGDANRLAIVLPAIPLEPEQVNFQIDDTVGVDLESFDPMAIRRRVAEELRSDADFDASITTEDDSLPSSATENSPLPSAVTMGNNPPPSCAEQRRSPPANPLPRPQSHQQGILRFGDGPNASLVVERPHKKPRTDAGPSKDPRKERRCARCVVANCALMDTCKGKGGRSRCTCVGADHDAAEGKRLPAMASTHSKPLQIVTLHSCPSPTSRILRWNHAEPERALPGERSFHAAGFFWCWWVPNRRLVQCGNLPPGLAITSRLSRDNDWGEIDAVEEQVHDPGQRQDTQDYSWRIRGSVGT